MAELRQQFAQLKGLLAQQQAELVELRGRIATSYGAAKARAGASSQRSGHASSRASSRRSLLKWGGATAAAAAVALAAGEQVAHAQPRSDGSAISAGNVTTAEHATTLKFDGTSGNAKVLFLAHDTSFHASDAKYPAALGGWVDGATSGNTTGVYGYSEASGGYGIVGVASGIGILGTSSEDNGVYATTTNTNGQAALSAINNGSSVGVYAQSNDDTLGSPAIQVCRQRQDWRRDRRIRRDQWERRIWCR